MKIVLATSNQGKVREIKAYMKEADVLAFEDVLEPFEIIEDGDTFKENALIKARAVYEALEDKSMVVLADDSGISVPVLGNVPGIYSARYAGKDASAKDNLYKLIDTLKENGLQTAPAFYTAAIAIVCEKGEFCVHGWMHGDAIADARGDNGFGYDPMFIPDGYDKTVGELDGETKEKLSHRTKGLQLAQKILATL